MTASMLRRTEPVVSLVPRFLRRVQSKRAAASTSWTGRFARKSVAAATACLRSASRVIVAMRIARRRAEWRHETHRSAPRDSVTAAAPKGVSITVITNGRTAPA
jgi:hypothetical protein